MCIVEELTQILGLLNDSDKITQSVFKDRGKHNELSMTDRISLYLRYNTGLTADMPCVEALKAIYAKLKKIHSGGI